MSITLKFPQLLEILPRTVNTDKKTFTTSMCLKLTAVRNAVLLNNKYQNLLINTIYI